MKTAKIRFIRNYKLVFLFVILTSFFYSNFSFCQTGSLIICNDFESETTNLTIESGIWEIGEPNKTVFNGSYNSANSIVTDLVNPYSENEASVFYLVYKDEYGGIPNYLDGYLPFELSFYHRFITNNENDFGSIEMSLDNGEIWYDVLSDDYNVYWDESYLNEHYFEATGETLYDSLEVYGDSEGWVHSHISKDIEGILWDNGFFQPDSLILRFSFNSDIGAGNDGWQIDSICMKMDIIDKVSQNLMENELKTYPNPASNYIVLEFPQNTTEAITRISDIFGKTIKELISTTNRVQWNCQGVANGVYFYQTKIDDSDSNWKVYRGKLVVQK